ncbi:DUF6382 domain-containing protein [Paenibacillus koleovorans]|uniref:DUF6382 domain-containing protein n=1 Tax=Paenibacillus koleovorans TaxID=121608 RepID=UPI000FD96F35|nr:DUF6382 domain-containing protein [Paenibacillus koleovorans]
MMSLKVRGLQFEFLSDPVGSLAASRTPAIRCEELQTIEVRMLQYNEIPGILAVGVEEVNRQARLIYRIGGKKMLADRLRREKLTQQRFLELLLNTVTVIAECREMMLNRENIMLDEELIFTGTDLTDLWFTYVPLADPIDEITIHARLRAFCNRMLAYIETMEGSSIPKLLQLMKEPVYSFTELADLLRAYLEVAVERKEEPVSVATMDEVPMKVEVPQPSAGLLSASGGASWINRLRDLKDEVDASNETGLLPEEREVFSEGEAKTPTNKPSRLRRLLIVGLVAAMGLMSGSFLLDSGPSVSGSPKFLISIGLFLAGGSAAFYYRKRHRSLSGFDREDGTSDLEKQTETVEPQESVWSRFAIAPASSTAYVEDIAVPDERTPSPKHEPLQTVLLSAAEPTVFLTYAENLRSHRAWLIVGTGPASERLELLPTPFLIGRKDGNPSYVLEESGVSKHHMEMTREDDAFYAKDLGSTNGTRLNGERMSPYKEYLMKDGDRIDIVRSSFVFKTSGL